MHTLLTRYATASLLAFAALSTQAEPVTLGYSSSSTPSHEYFTDDPVIAAQVQIVGSGGSWQLQRGVSKRLALADVYLSTGPAAEGCCLSEVHAFVFDLTVEGVTRQITAAVKMTEINNNQYQFNMLDQPNTVFDLGSQGLLTLDLWDLAFQTVADTPFYQISHVYAFAHLGERPQTVPLPATLALASLGLLMLGLQRRRHRR